MHESISPSSCYLGQSYMNLLSLTCQSSKMNIHWNGWQKLPSWPVYCFDSLFPPIWHLITHPILVQTPIFQRCRNNCIFKLTNESVDSLFWESKNAVPGQTMQHIFLMPLIHIHAAAGTRQASVMLTHTKHAITLLILAWLLCSSS